MQGTHETQVHSLCPEDDNLLQYSCLGNPMDQGAWQAMSMGLPTVGHGWARTNIIMNWEFYPSQIWERLAQPHWLWKRVELKLERYSSSPVPRGPPQSLDHPSSWTSQGNPQMAWFHSISRLWKNANYSPDCCRNQGADLSAGQLKMSLC